MYFYLINIAIFLIYSAILHFSRQDKFIWWISLIQFGLITAFRDEHVGADTISYCNYYMNIGKMDSLIQAIQRQLGGMAFLLWPIRKILPYRWMWMILSGGVTTVCVWLFIRINSPNPFLSIYFYITCYFYFQAMNAGRQSMAMGMALIAISLIYKEQYLRALPFIAIALMTHSGGAIIVLLAYPVFLIRWTPKRYLLVLIGSMLASMAFATMQSIFVRLFSYYERYSYTSWQSQGRSFWFFLLIAFFMLYALVILLQKNRGKSVVRGFMPPAEYMDNSGTQIVWGNAAMITFQLALCIILSRLVFVSRATSLCMWLYILFIPQVLAYKTRIRNLVTCIMMVGTFGYMFLRLAGNYSIICPYRSFLG